MKAIVFSFLILVFALLVGASEAKACVCTNSPTVLDEFAKAPIVMTATLDAFEELDRIVAGTNVYRTMAAVMTVEKSYKGTMKAGQVIKVLDGGGGDCSKGFVREQVGQKFLFFTSPAVKRGNLPGKLFWISSCSRTARLEDAGPDIAYLDNRAKLLGKTRLSGMVKRFGPEPPSLAKIRVTVSGKNFEQSAETNEHGFFELWDLPAGQYRVAFHVPSGTGIGAYKTSPERAWRRISPPDNTIQAAIAAGKHLEITIGLDSRAAKGQ
ncbi:MAG TPA: hypothetical protein VL572_04360 [Pyrinomonadaceae bacterium]|nr:hypothetical protein [Pyrinomonadaceae bacterium]